MAVDWFLIIAACWILIGLTSVLFFVRSDIQKGDDLRLKDLGACIGCTFLGPITLIGFVCMMFQEHGDMVLIKGKKKDENV